MIDIFKKPMVNYLIEGGHGLTKRCPFSTAMIGSCFCTTECKHAIYHSIDGDVLNSYVINVTCNCKTRFK